MWGGTSISQATKTLKRNRQDRASKRTIKEGVSAFGKNQDYKVVDYKKATDQELEQIRLKIARKGRITRTKNTILFIFLASVIAFLIWYLFKDIV